MGSPIGPAKVKTGEEFVNTAGYAIINEIPEDSQAVCKCAAEGTIADEEASKLFGAGKKFLDDKKPLGTCVCSILKRPAPPLHPIRNLSDKETAKLEETIYRTILGSLKGSSITGQYNPFGGKETMEGKKRVVFDILTTSAARFSREDGVLKIELDIKRRELGENTRDVIEAERVFKPVFSDKIEGSIKSLLKSIGIKGAKLNGEFSKGKAGLTYSLTIGA